MANKYINGEKLKQLRKETGLTQAEMGERLGISRETVINIEKNHPPTVGNLSLDLVNSWGRVCRSHLSTATRRGWQDYLKKLLDLN